MEIGISIEKLEIIRELTLYTFEELRKDHEEIKELVNRLRNMIQFEMDLPRIEHVLRKGEVKKEEFFRKEPLWIDFEKGCIVERKEVDEIIQKLRNDKIHLVLGKPASGKSVILKNIGFKLANENEKVYFIELKKLSDEEVKQYFGKIPNLNAIFIVDDAHLKLSACEKLARDFRMKGKGLLLIGSRETYGLKEHPMVASEFEYLRKNEMIHLFLRKKQLSDSKIEAVAESLKEYKHDLWLLSWALKAYKPEKDTVEEIEIIENGFLQAGNFKTSPPIINNIVTKKKFWLYGSV